MLNLYGSKEVMIIRNDDIAFDTNVEELKWFCDLCDKYGFKILQAITPLGTCEKIHVKMSDDEIVALGGKHTIIDNRDLMEYLWHRHDIIGVHGLWHTHSPSMEDIMLSKKILESIDLKPTYFVTPFNEGIYPPEVCGLITSQKTQRLEDYLKNDKIPTDQIIYCHSWRFGSWYPKESLEKCLKRISSTIPKSNEDIQK